MGGNLDDFDRELLRLLEARIAAWQEDSATPSDVMDAPHGVSKADFRDLLRHLDSLCRKAKSTGPKVTYLGPIYSYSYLAAVHHFGLATTMHPVSTIGGAFDALLRKQCDYGVVPIENSTDGRVVDTLGMLAREPVRICAEVLYPIHHCLLANCQHNEIKEVHSKPQALSQCRDWLATHLPNAKQVEVSSTAAAAIAATKTDGVAAIASKEAGIHNGLAIVSENIEDNQTNVTRFAVIGDAETKPSGNDKTALMLQLHHRPGALAQAMEVFNTLHLNLTWIESFPMPGAPNEYLFFVEVEGHTAEEGVSQAITNLREQVLRLEVLGAYPRG